MIKLLTVTDVAELLSVSKTLIYTLVEQGDLPYVPIGKSKAYRFDPQDIATFIQSRKIQNASRKPTISRPRLKHIKL